MFTPFRVWCPAKINLFLSVGPRDDRNYHPLRTVFQSISLSDELIFQPGTGKVTWEFPDPRIEFEVPTRNTVTKTIGRLHEIAPLPHFDVKVVKRIPVESGLGGGSSDAAGVIRAAEHWVGPLPMAEKIGIAASVGADVPYFLVGGQAYAEGYGERLTAWPDQPSQTVVIAKPAASCSTASMFQQLDEIVRAWRDYTAGEHYNDFERVAPKASLDLIETLLVEGADRAGLTGSGSAVYAIFSDPNDAAFASKNLSAAFTWIGESISRDQCFRLELMNTGA